MAINTKAKRMSMLSYCHPMQFYQLFERDGAVDADDRATLLHLYGGTLLLRVPYIEPLPQRIVRHAGRYA